MKLTDFVRFEPVVLLREEFVWLALAGPSRAPPPSPKLKNFTAVFRRILVRLKDWPTSLWGWHPFPIWEILDPPLKPSVSREYVGTWSQEDTKKIRGTDKENIHGRKKDKANMCVS